jgi:diadenylate cyclase
MHYFAIIEHLRFRDVIDILFLTAVAYYLYTWFRGTKALKALIGLLALGSVYTVARSWGLFLTTWAFQILWQVLIILLIVLFSSEIRQVLERVNPLRIIGLHRFSGSPDWIVGFVKGIFRLSTLKTGALIVIERQDRVAEWVTSGIQLTGEPVPELLLSVFQKESPLHDGAMVIKEGSVSHVSCYLPLSSAEGLPKEWGTRHRAALGLSERCDAWVIVVSEERGSVSLARGGEVIHLETPEQVGALVLEAIQPPNPPKSTWWERGTAPFTRNWPIKLGSLTLVCALWFLLAGQQDFEVALRVPLEVKNTPPTLEVLEPQKPFLEIRVRGLRKDVSTLTERNIHCAVDLSLAHLGTGLFRISRELITLPNDRIQVMTIEPAQMEFKFREKF